MERMIFVCEDLEERIYLSYTMAFCDCLEFKQVSLCLSRCIPNASKDSPYCLILNAFQSGEVSLLKVLKLRSYTRSLIWRTSFWKIITNIHCDIEPKCTEIWSENVPDFSHLVTIWPTLGPHLVPLNHMAKVNWERNLIRTRFYHHLASKYHSKSLRIP